MSRFRPGGRRRFSWSPPSSAPRLLAPAGETIYPPRRPESFEGEDRRALPTAKLEIVHEARRLESSIAPTVIRVEGGCSQEGGRRAQLDNGSTSTDGRIVFGADVNGLPRDPRGSSSRGPEGAKSRFPAAPMGEDDSSFRTGPKTQVASIRRPRPNVASGRLPRTYTTRESRCAFKDSTACIAVLPRGPARRPSDGQGPCPGRGRDLFDMGVFRGALRSAAPTIAQVHEQGHDRSSKGPPRTASSGSAEIKAGRPRPDRGPRPRDLRPCSSTRTEEKRVEGAPRGRPSPTETTGAPLPPLLLDTEGPRPPGVKANCVGQPRSHPQGSFEELGTVPQDRAGARTSFRLVGPPLELGEARVLHLGIPVIIEALKARRPETSRDVAARTCGIAALPALQRPGQPRLPPRVRRQGPGEDVAVAPLGSVGEGRRSGPIIKRSRPERDLGPGTAATALRTAVREPATTRVLTELDQEGEGSRPTPRRSLDPKDLSYGLRRRPALPSSSRRSTPTRPCRRARALAGPIIPLRAGSGRARARPEGELKHVLNKYAAEDAEVPALPSRRPHLGRPRRRRGAVEAVRSSTSRDAASLEPTSPRHLGRASANSFLELRAPPPPRRAG